MAEHLRMPALREAAGAANQPPADVLRWNRLVPGRRLSERIHSFPDQGALQGGGVQATFGRFAGKL